MKSMGRYTVVSYASTSFLQLFLWERFNNLGPKPTLFEAINMLNVEDENGIVRSVPYKPVKMRASDGPGRIILSFADIFLLPRDSRGEVIRGTWE